MLIKCHQVPYFLSLKGLSGNRQQREQQFNIVSVKSGASQGIIPGIGCNQHGALSMSGLEVETSLRILTYMTELVLRERTLPPIIFQMFSYFKHRESEK